MDINYEHFTSIDSFFEFSYSSNLSASHVKSAVILFERVDFFLILI